MCGEAIHLAECSLNHDGCSTSTHRPSAAHKPQEPSSSSCCVNHTDNKRRNQESSGEHSQHDSSNCWVCQVLGQAQSQAIVIDIPASAEVAPAIIAANPVPCLPPGRTGLQLDLASPQYGEAVV